MKWKLTELLYASQNRHQTNFSQRFNIRKNGYHYVTPQRLAGRQGEVFVSGLIKEVLTPEDIHLENIPIEADGMQAELGNESEEA